MLIKVDAFDDYFCRVHFGVSYKECLNITNDVVLFDSMFEEENKENILYSKIDAVYLDIEMSKRKIVPLASKKTYFFTKFEKNKPIIGVSSFIRVPENIELIIPSSIPYYIDSYINEVLSRKEEEWKKNLLANDFCYKQSGDCADEYSVVTYDLKVYKNNECVETLCNQVVDMTDEADLFFDFLSSKLGDEIIVEDNDETKKVIAIITSIVNRVPYSKEKHEASHFEDIGYEDYDSAHDSFIESIESVTKTEIYMDYIINFAIENSRIEFSKRVIDFYKGFDDIGISFMKDNTSRKPEEIAKRVLFLDIIERLVKLKKGVYISNEDVFAKYLYDIEYFYATNLLDTIDVSKYISKTSILDYYKKNKIIKGIKI